MRISAETLLRFSGRCKGFGLFCPKSLHRNKDTWLWKPWLSKLSALFSTHYIMGIMDGVVMRIGLAWLLGNALNLGIDGYWYGSAIAGFTFFVVGAPYYWSGIWKKRLPSHTA